MAFPAAGGTSPSTPMPATPTWLWTGAASTRARSAKPARAGRARTAPPRATWSATRRDSDRGTIPPVGQLYDSIGKRYTDVRREDPRIAARIRAALGDARTVVNVGAGAGAYEPGDLEVTAVEPSETMIAQRPEGAAPVVRAFAEELPF